MKEKLRGYEDVTDRNSTLIDSLEGEILEAERAFIAEFKKWRKKKGYSLRKTAALLGISPAYLSDIDNGRRGLSYEVLEKIKKLT